MTRLILLRHGLTRLTEGKAYCGITNPGLTDTGIKQAELLKPRMDDERVDCVYASDLKRTSEFAALVFGQGKAKLHRELREMDFGILEGLTHEQALAKYPKDYSRWLDDPESIAIKDSESLQGLKERVGRFVKEVVRRNTGKTIAIVTHGGPIRVVLQNVLSGDALTSIRVRPASVSILEYGPQGALPIVTDDTSHLKEEGHG